MTGADSTPHKVIRIIKARLALRTVRSETIAARKLQYVGKTGFVLRIGSELNLTVRQIP